jgi:hypothetical protein
MGIWMKKYAWKVPKDVKIGNNKNLIFRKTIYGLVQNGRKFFEKFNQCFKSYWILRKQV